MQISSDVFCTFECVFYNCELFNEFSVKYSNDYQAHYLVGVTNDNVFEHDYCVYRTPETTFNPLVDWFEYETIFDDLYKRFSLLFDRLKNELGLDFHWYYCYHDCDTVIESGHVVKKKPHTHVLFMFSENISLQHFYNAMLNTFQRYSYKIGETFTKRGKEYTTFVISYPMCGSESARCVGYDEVGTAYRVRYLTHLTNADKYQYSPERVVGDLNYSTDARLCEDDDYSILRVTSDWILSHKHSTANDIMYQIVYYAPKHIQKEYRQKHAIYNLLVGR